MNKPKKQELWTVLLWPFALLLVSVWCLSIHRFKLAAIPAAFAIYDIITRTIPAFLHRTVAHFIRQHKYEQAEKLAKFGIAFCKFFKLGRWGNLPRSFAWDMLLKDQLARILNVQARWAEALKIHQEILSLLEAEHDIDGVCQISGRMAYCYTQLGQLSKAEALLAHVIPTLEAAANNADIANDALAKAYLSRLSTALFEQANLLECKRDFKAAEKVRRKAADISIQLYGDDLQLEVMPHLSMLGKVLIRLERYDDAEKLLKKVYEIRVRGLPADSTLIASAKQGLGRLYCATDRLGAAGPYLTEALESLKKVGTEHPDMPSYEDDLAKLLIKQNKFTEAEKLLLSAIKQKEKQCGKDHPYLIDYLLDLSELKGKIGDLTEAETLKQRVNHIQAMIT